MKYIKGVEFYMLLEPSNIMIYKIVRDFEDNRITEHKLSELSDFTERVIERTNSICGARFWSFANEQTIEELQKICDIDLKNHICELNLDKFNGEGRRFAHATIATLSIDMIKVAQSVCEEERCRIVNNNCPSL